MSNEGSGGSSKKSGQFPGFIRNMQWKDRDEKYILFINRATDIPTVEYHSFVPAGVWPSGKTKFEEFISRTDPGVGESTDDLTDRLGKKAQLRSIAVAVELEPTYTTVNGRRRPNGFAVKTESFERKKEDGTVEEVEAPVVNMVVQSPQNFFGWVGSFDQSTSEIEKTPLLVTRRGGDQNTAYDFTPFLDQPIDFTGLLDNYQNISYLRDQDVDLTGDDETEKALAIGTAVLDKRLGELTDADRYKEIVEPITHIEDKFGSKDSKPIPSVKSKSTSEEAPAKGTARFEDLRRMHEGS
jgi:hypothetical protein